VPAHIANVRWRKAVLLGLKWEATRKG